MITPTWTYSNIQCFVNNTKCCQAQLTFDYAEKLKSKGITSCMKSEVDKLLFMNYQLQVLSRYAPEGDVIVAEELATWTLTIVDVSPGSDITISIGSTVIGTATSAGTDNNVFADALAASINANGSGLDITALRPDPVVGLLGTVTIVAPVGSGFSYNGVVLTVVVDRVTYTSFNDAKTFLGGVDEVLADEPCITDKQARDIYEQLDNLCGGGCGCSDDDIYSDIIN